MATAIPSNQASFTLEEILEATSAVVSSGTKLPRCTGVTTDSRGDVAGKLFVALSGEHFDGHRFVADVLARGAYGVVVERPVEHAAQGLTFHVTSTLDALGALANLHRTRWGGRIITIGGSAGKTTTRTAVQEFLSALLPGKVCGTAGNLNNLIGVPMTLLSILPEHEFAVIEVGTNQPGEVERLSAICVADVAVLTCIGLEHSEGLGDLDEIEREEGALFQHLRDGATVVGWGDDVRVAKLLEAARVSRRFTYGVAEGSTRRILERRMISRELSFIRVGRSSAEGHSEVVIHTRLCGLPGALATAAAVAVADALNISIEPSIAEFALDRQIGEVGRLRIAERQDRALVIDDCYNANPISMRSSFGVARELAQAEGRRLIFVLGEMRELGELSEREHTSLADELEGVSQIIAVGQQMRPFVARAKQQGQSVRYFDSAEAALGSVASFVLANDVVLVKGSRGVKLERVVAAILGGEGHA